MKKNDVLTLTVEDLNAQGQGVCRVDGQILFVPGALPGEAVNVQVIKITARYAVGRLLSYTDPNPQRAEPACPYFPRCGGCTWQHMQRPLQLAQKEQNVRMAFRKAGMTVDTEPILYADDWHYRNKGQFPAVRSEGGAEIGMYAARSHRLIPVESCMIQEEPVNQVLRAVKAWAREHSVPGYDEATGTGLLRHVCARHVSGQTMAVLVVTDFHVPRLEDLLGRLREQVPTLTGLLLNLNRQRDNRIYGRQIKTIWGKDTIRADLNGISLEISALAFLQVNTEGMRILYDTVSEFAAIGPEDVVYDAYCGVGSIGLYTAGNAKALYGVEEVVPAVLDARRNAMLNGAKQAEYEAGRAEDIFPRWVEEGRRPSVLIIDPPFKGCHESFLKAVIQADPKKIVYVSCNPATLARDAAFLCGNGYGIDRIRPVDLFPHSEHVECVTLMTRKETN